MMSAKDYIIIPTYNEKNNISAIVPVIFSVVPSINIMVVDDSSPDGTADAVREMIKNNPNLSVHTRPTKNGLGGAYIEGFKTLLKDREVGHIIMMDADFQHDPKYLPELLRQGQKYDLVIGSRYAKGGGVVGWPIQRKLLSICSRTYARLMLGRKITDWGSGLNCISTSALRKLDFNNMNLSGHEFIIGLKYKLLASGATSKEIPVILQNRREGDSKVTLKLIIKGLMIPWKL